VERTTEGAQALASAETARPGAAIGEPKMVWAVPCDCTSGDRTDRALARARVPERYRHCDFANFDTDLPYEHGPRDELIAWNRSLAFAKTRVQSFAREFPSNTKKGFLLMGSFGVGKTHLGIAALKEIVLRGHSGLFYDYRELLKEIQDSYNSESRSTEMSVLEPVLKADVLLLDDLGSSKPSDWALETVGHILTTRYNEEHITMITTNFLDPEFNRRLENKPSTSSASFRGREAPPDTFASVHTLPSGELIRTFEKETFADRVGKRIRSRLYEMCETIEVQAPDYRKEVRHFRFHA
jgi:DNA replication protein DnaC